MYVASMLRDAPSFMSAWVKHTSDLSTGSAAALVTATFTELASQVAPECLPPQAVAERERGGGGSGAGGVAA